MHWVIQHNLSTNFPLVHISLGRVGSHWLEANGGMLQSHCWTEQPWIISGQSPVSLLRMVVREGGWGVVPRVPGVSICSLAFVLGIVLRWQWVHFWMTSCGPGMGMVQLWWPCMVCEFQYHQSRCLFIMAPRGREWGVEVSLSPWSVPVGVNKG